MRDKFKSIGSHLTQIAAEAAGGVAVSVKDGAGSIADAASAAATTLNEKAVRKAVEQMRTALQVASEELQKRPISARPVTLTASVNLGVTALEMQIVMAGEDGVSNPPREVPPRAEPA